MSTRSQKKTTIAVNSAHKKRVENSWVLLTKDFILENSSFSIITLPNPSNGKPIKYCLDGTHKKIFEVITFNEPNRSWFIGESVKSDGSIQMTTPVNPIFLVLPKLREQCNSRAIPLEDLLSDKSLVKLMDFIDNLDNVADLKGPRDMKAYKYNEDKTLSWLEDRVKKVAKVLRAKNIHVTSGAVSATFVTSNVSNGYIDDEFYLKYAFGIVSEYLQEDLASKLEKKFHFKPDLVETIGNKRKSEVAYNETNKKTKCDISLDDKEIMDLCGKSTSENKKQKPLTTKEKARQKAACGTKMISSFFTKK